MLKNIKKSNPKKSNSKVRKSAKVKKIIKIIKIIPQEEAPILYYKIKKNQPKKYRLLNYKYLNFLKLYNYEILKEKKIHSRQIDVNTIEETSEINKLIFRIRGSKRFYKLAKAYLCLGQSSRKLIRNILKFYRVKYSRLVCHFEHLVSGFADTGLYSLHKKFNNVITEFGEFWMWELFVLYFRAFCVFEKSWPPIVSLIARVYHRKRKRKYKPMFAKKLKFLQNYIRASCKRKIHFSYRHDNYFLLHIRKTSNNTCILVAKPNGKILFWSTSGVRKFEGPKRNSFTANLAVARSIYFKMLVRQIRVVKIILKSSRGRVKIKHVLRVFAKKSSKKKKLIRVLAFLNMTPISFNGCMRKKERR